MERSFEQRYVIVSELVGNLQWVTLVFNIDLVLLLDVFASNKFLKVLVVNRASVLVKLASNTPNGSKNDCVHTDFLNVARHIKSLMSFSLPVINDEKVKDLQDVVHHEVTSSRHSLCTFGTDKLHSQGAHVKHDLVDLGDNFLFHVSLQHLDVRLN